MKPITIILARIVDETDPRWRKFKILELSGAVGVALRTANQGFAETVSVGDFITQHEANELAARPEVTVTVRLP